MPKLNWFAGRVDASTGVWFLDARTWGESDADLTFLTNASGGGLAFWSPELGIAQVASIAEEDLSGLTVF